MLRFCHGSFQQLKCECVTLKDGLFRCSGIHVEVSQ